MNNRRIRHAAARAATNAAVSIVNGVFELIAGLVQAVAALALLALVIFAIVQAGRYVHITPQRECGYSVADWSVREVCTVTGFDISFGR